MVEWNWDIRVESFDKGIVLHEDFSQYLLLNLIGLELSCSVLG